MKGKYTYTTNKTCPQCGEKFKTLKPRQNCCSPECARKFIQRARDKKYHNVVLKCDWCGNEYTPRIAFQRFCTISCGQAAHRQRKSAESRGEEPILKRDAPKQDRAVTYDEMGIDKVRDYHGMRPLAPAQVKCLSCGNVFKSKDKFTNRICPNCKDNEEYVNNVWF